MLAHKGVSQEVQLINIWDIVAYRDVLTNGKNILELGIDVLDIRMVLLFLITPLITKGWITDTINGAGIIFSEYHVSVYNRYTIYYWWKEIRYPWITPQ